MLRDEPRREGNMYEIEFVDTWDYLTCLDGPTADELEAVESESE